MHALVIGATGATGKQLVQQLLQDSQVEKITIFVRRPLGFADPKLQVEVVDFADSASWADKVRGDVLFSCLGTTLKAAGSKQAQRVIDFDYPVAFAQAAKQNGVAKVVLISAQGANPQSRVFYSRLKGELEQAHIALNLPHLIIFRPPLLERENSDRAAEVWFARILHGLNRLGILTSQKPMPVSQLANKMIRAAHQSQNALEILQPKDIWAY